MGKTATGLSDLPGKPFWAIVFGESQHIPGDERSRTNPGHGYPAHTINHLNLEVFESEDDWRDRIAELAKRQHQEKFKAFVMTPAQIETHVSVTVRT